MPKCKEVATEYCMVPYSSPHKLISAIILIIILLTIGGRHWWAFAFAGSLLCLVVFSYWLCLVYWLIIAVFCYVYLFRKLKLLILLLQQPYQYTSKRFGLSFCTSAIHITTALPHPANPKFAWKMDIKAACVYKNGCSQPIATFFPARPTYPF